MADDLGSIEHHKLDGPVRFWNLLPFLESDAELVRRVAVNHVIRMDRRCNSFHSHHLKIPTAIKN